MKKVFLPLIASCRANRSLPSELAVGHLTPKAVKQDQPLTFSHENKAYEQEVRVNVLKHLLTCWNLLVWLLLKKGPSGLLLIVMASNRTICLCDFTLFLSDFFVSSWQIPKSLLHFYFLFIQLDWESYYGTSGSLLNRNLKIQPCGVAILLVGPSWETQTATIIFRTPGFWRHSSEAENLMQETHSLQEQQLKSTQRMWDVQDSMRVTFWIPPPPPIRVSQSQQCTNIPASSLPPAGARQVKPERWAMRLIEWAASRRRSHQICGGTWGKNSCIWLPAPWACSTCLIEDRSKWAICWPGWGTGVSY